jgi:type III secretion YscU/HrpY family protein
MGEKTEKASSKKIRDARKKGQVAKSQDFPAAVTFVVSMAVTLASITAIHDNISRFFIDCFSLVTHPHLLEILTDLFIRAIYIIFITTIPVVLAVCFTGMLATFFVVGPMFASEVFKFDIKKFNPIDNLKGKFKMKTVIELLKSCAKISIAGIIVYKVCKESIPTLMQAIHYPVADSLTIYSYFLWKVIIRVGLFFGAVAIFDFMYQKYTFGKEMMMEKFEVKQEYKESEGNPELKGRRKEIAREIAYAEGPGAGVSKASAVVTNPNHLAIALGFDRELDPCPYVLAMGQGNNAELIIQVAEKYAVPIVRNIPLAHSLWGKAKLYEYIPEETYEPVAEILRWLAELEFEKQNPIL